MLIPWSRLTAALGLVAISCNGDPPKPPPSEGAPCPPDSVALDSTLIASWRPNTEPDLHGYWVRWHYVDQGGRLVQYGRHFVTDTVDTMRFVMGKDSVIVRSPSAAKSMFWAVLPDTAGFKVTGLFELGMLRDSLYYVDRSYRLLSHGFDPDWWMLRTYNDDKSGGALSFEYGGEDTSTVYLIWDARSGAAPQGWGAAAIGLAVSDAKAEFAVFSRKFLRKQRKAPEAVVVAVSAEDSTGNISPWTLDAVGWLNN